MNFKKRGQLTIFVILGIVIVIGIVAFYVYQSSADERYFNQGAASDDVNNIKDYMVSCLEYLADESVTVVQIQAGYYEHPLRYEDLGNGTFLPYYTYQGTTYFPNLESIEGELATAVDDSVGACLDYATFTGYDVTYNTVETSVDIRDNEIEFVVDLPVTIEAQGKRTILQMSQYPIVIPSRLKAMHNVARYYVEDIEDDNEYCVNCLAEIAKANNVYVDVMALDELTSGVIISEGETYDGNYTHYIFLNKFNEGAFSDDGFLESFEDY